MSRRLAAFGVGIVWASSVLLCGCDRNPDQARPETGATGATSAATQSAADPALPAETSRRPTGVDRQDDPAAPRALPKTHELHGWIKTEPVQVFPPDRLAEALFATDLADAFGTFRIRKAARCAYRHDSTVAQVLLIEAESANDAFGVFSIMTPRSGVFHPADGTIRVVTRESGAVVATGWQGDIVAQIRCVVQSAAGEPALSAEQCEGLLVRILVNGPSAEPPWLLRAILSEKGEMTKVWLVRRTAALTAVGHPVLRQIDPGVMDARLGLNGEVFLAVASVPVAKGERPNIIWLVRYETPADAQAAGQRYQQALQSARGALDANTITDEPKGRFLVGSWTADQESLQNLLPKFRTILPD